MFARPKNLVTVAVITTCLIGITGCNTSTDPAESTAFTQSTQPTSATPSVQPKPSSTPKPTPTPVPASSNGPAKNWPVPKMPDVAKEKSEKGIVAFTKYWFDLVTYSDNTNDTAPIKAVTSRECHLCAKQIIDPVDYNKSVGAWRSGGDIQASMTMAKLINASGFGGFLLQREEITAYLASGKVQASVPKTKKPMVGTLYLQFENGWQVIDLEFIQTGTNSK